MNSIRNDAEITRSNEHIKKCLQLIRSHHHLLVIKTFLLGEDCLITQVCQGILRWSGIPHWDWHSVYVSDFHFSYLLPWMLPSDIFGKRRKKNYRKIFFSLFLPGAGAIRSEVTTRVYSMSIFKSSLICSLISSESGNFARALFKYFLEVSRLPFLK